MALSWTCPECGLDYDTVSAADAAVALRSFPRRYREALEEAVAAGGDDRIRRRPEPGVWSALEYTAHVGDTLGAMAGEYRRVVEEPSPELAGWDPDERAAEQRYGEQPLDRVLADLERGAVAAAEVVEGTGPEHWDRTGRYPYGERDLLTMVRNGVHEGSHHLRDVEDVLRRVESAS